jgi:hypothetical protein
MAIFGLYYTKNILRLMQWPRSQGIIKKSQYIDSMIFDSTIEQMVDWAAALGAGKPWLALQIIAYTFRDADWEGVDPPQLKRFCEELNENYYEEGIDFNTTAPHNIVHRVYIAENFGPTIKADALLDKRLQGRLEQDFLGGLMYGLSNPKSFEAWHSHHLSEFERTKGLTHTMDIGVDKLPTLSETYRDSEEVVRNYQQEMGIDLPSIPAKLLADGKALRGH